MFGKSNQKFEASSPTQSTHWEQDERGHVVGGGAEAFDPDAGVKRGLKNRHLSMMALAGIIGTVSCGLLVSDRC